MAISVFDLFSIGIGPSSSHTVGPMRAARRFAKKVLPLDSLTSLNVELFGSLAHTGKGHCTDTAILLGLEGEQPHSIQTQIIAQRINTITQQQQIQLMGKKSIPFNIDKDLLFHQDKDLPNHPNGMRFTAFDASHQSILQKNYYSVGGGFILSDDTDVKPIQEAALKLPYAFETGDALIALCEKTGFSIAALMLENEKVWRSEQEVYQNLDLIWSTMSACIDTGIQTEGILPGSLKVKRRAPELYRRITSRKNIIEPLSNMDWVNLYALAVNEENAAGGRIVTAPTNGAAGIIPAVIKYYCQFYQPQDNTAIRRFLLTAGAIGILYKLNASISGAEVGCQGEVGVACSMAAGALTEVLGGTPKQVECAAEIGMEHNLGLTCDPVGGLVQIPCIERNAMGAIKAINASKLALQGDGTQKVSLDKVIQTMKATGADMQSKYKETAQGGLAVNIIEC